MTRGDFTRIIKNCNPDSKVEFITALFAPGLKTTFSNINYENDYYLLFNSKHKAYYLPYDTIIGLILDGGKDD